MRTNLSKYSNYLGMPKIVFSNMKFLLLHKICYSLFLPTKIGFFPQTSNILVFGVFDKPQFSCVFPTHFHSQNLRSVANNQTFNFYRERDGKSRTRKAVFRAGQVPLYSPNDTERIVGIVRKCHRPNGEPLLCGCAEG